MKPLVTVCIFAFNHEKYITQAIESVLSQETNFEFEVLVGEDGSTDRTMDILLRFQKLNSKKLQILEQDQSKKIYINGIPTGRWNFINTLSCARGKYISLLDGDDYWTDTFKLQKQVDFLESNPEYSASFHRVKVKDEFNNVTSLSEDFAKETFDLYDMTESVLINTCSFIMRKKVIESETFLSLLDHSRDYLVFLTAAQIGKIKFFHEVMGVYRIHAGGVWVGDKSNRKYLNHYQLICGIEKAFAGEDSAIISNFKKQKEWALQNWIRDYLHSNEFSEGVYEKLIQTDMPIITELLYREVCAKNRKYEKLLHSKKMKLANMVTYPFTLLQKLKRKIIRNLFLLAFAIIFLFEGLF